MKKWNNKIKCSVSFPPEIWFDLSFFRVNQFVPAVTQMSLHVVYFKWIEGPRVVCGLASAVKSSTCPLAPSPPPHCGFSGLHIIFYRNSASASLFSALLCSGVTTLFSVFSAVTSSLWYDLYWDTHTTPHRTPTWWWQDCSDRKPSLASWVFLNSSHMLNERDSGPGSSFLSLVKKNVQMWAASSNVSSIQNFIWTPQDVRQST